MMNMKDNQGNIIIGVFIMGLVLMTLGGIINNDSLTFVGAGVWLAGIAALFIGITRLK